MSLNTAHASNGVLIHTGEHILLHCDFVKISFGRQGYDVFQGVKQGRVFLTTHRLIFNCKMPCEALKSFSAPFIAMKDVNHVMNANTCETYIKGTVRAQPNGNFGGVATFKLHLLLGGACEFGCALKRAVDLVHQDKRNGKFMENLPPYEPARSWYEAHPEAYEPPKDKYDWLPKHAAFSEPPTNAVYITDLPPPYPGLVGPPEHTPFVRNPPLPPWP